MLSVLSVMIHLIPFVFYGPHPLGYDTGFYRRYVIQSFVSFPNPPVPGLGKDALGPRLFLDAVRLLHLPPDIMLYGTYIFLFALQVLSLFFLTTYYWGVPAGCVAALFFILSPIQYTAYWFMLFKHAFATVAMLIAFLLIEKKSRWAIPAGILIAISHHTTTIIFLLTLIVYILINKKERKRTILVFIATLIPFLFFHLSAYQTYMQFPVAVFVEWREYISLSFPLFALALCGITITINKRKTVFSAFTITAVLFPLFLLPFYKRVFIFTDIAMIIMGTCGLVFLIDEIKNNSENILRIASSLIVVIAMALFSINIYGRIYNLRPLVSRDTLKEWENVTPYIQPNSTIITSAVRAPWVYGWSRHTIIAPGLLNDTRTAQEWILFWNGSLQNKVNFLKHFPRPLYFFLSPREREKLISNLNDCVQKQSPYLFQYHCK